MKTQKYDKDSLEIDLLWFESKGVDRKEAEHYIKYLLGCRWVK
jgi:hypothetical protein